MGGAVISHDISRQKKKYPQLFGPDGKMDMSKQQELLRGQMDLDALLKRHNAMKEKAAKDK